MIGTASTSSGSSSTTVDAVFRRPWIDTAARMNPRQSAPESPMKIRAGKKLWRRKPRQAPATIAERIAGSGLPRDSARIAYVTPAIPHTPAASPSMPSRKLTMFITATMKSIESGTPIHAGMSSTPMNGNVMWSIQTPNIGGIDAATNWPASFTDGESPRKSSTAPTTVAIAAPSSTPLLSPERSRNASAGTRIPRKIASPPSRGIGRRLMRRASGRSTAPSMRAMPPTAGVRRTTMTNATSAP